MTDENLRYQSRSRLDTRYATRLRSGGFREDQPLNLDEIFGDDLGVWDTVGNQWVKRDATGEWVPE